MPAPGDQHTSIPNPFEEPKQRISEFTAQEIATLQSRLDKQLGPEYLSSRAGPAGLKVYYITAEKCIALANEVFGFNGWSSSIQNIQTDYADEDPKTLRVSLGLSVIVRVTLRDGTYHEDIGYGHVENAKGKAAAYEKAKKEGTTDALKRALRHFGNVLGNCIYDKAYLAKVTKMKAAPVKFDESCLHRHPDFVVKKDPAENRVSKEETSAPQPGPPRLPSAESFEDLLGELDEADFNISDEGHPDEIVLPNSNETDSNRSNASNSSRNQSDNTGSNSMQPPARQLARSVSAGNNPPRQAPQTPVQQPPRPNTNNFPGAQNRGPPAGPRPPQQFNQNRPAAQPNNANQNLNQNPSAHRIPPQAAGNNSAAPTKEPVSFFSARAVKQLPEETLANGTIVPKADQAFNLHYESPSIRRTPGVDRRTSRPVTKSGQHAPPRKSIVDDENDSDVNAFALPNKPAAMGGQQQSVAGAGSGPSRPGPQNGRPGPGLGNVVNPQLDQTRRIGAPPVSSSPVGNRGQFRPLTVKRPAGSDSSGSSGSNGGGAARVPLEDVSNNPFPGAGAAGGNASEPDAKRLRTS
ncbi:hypothetical protein C8A03DRAFT_30855 [Achaetomium macrosporum]|uniref:RAD52 homolog n=1 Tax=Achaetomium macrosporum TaxID=79813 RepID=A0AAN7CFU7_9PEZI|nr:hypothetical protein C8A03DRAFT_30855 [Achaetomium macrosporum]